jgi:hypothetical protein
MLRNLWFCWWNTALHVAVVGTMLVCLPELRWWPLVVIAVVGLAANIWASLDMRRVYRRWEDTNA